MSLTKFSIISHGRKQQPLEQETETSFELVSCKSKKIEPRNKGSSPGESLKATFAWVISKGWNLAQHYMIGENL